MAGWRFASAPHRREQDDGQVAEVGIFANALTKLEAIHDGHGDVGNHKIRPIGSRHREAFGTIVRDADHIACICEKAAQHFRLDAAVLDNENVCHIDQCYRKVAPLRSDWQLASVPTLAIAATVELRSVLSIVYESRKQAGSSLPCRCDQYIRRAPRR